MQPLQTPSIEHAEFERLREQLDEFEPLLPGPGHDLPQDHEEEHPLDGQILAGLVNPAYGGDGQGSPERRGDPAPQQPSYDAEGRLSSAAASAS